ncbi:mucin-2 [Streptomyces sp. NPDC018031]|uniref:mucin-2 n=1 Tax=Streptomyces sp. NPDC018031 TaxID=3365033 RepID=UPI00378CF980
MRMVSPKDLEQLAKLLDGKGGLGDKLREAFTRAQSLGVSDKLTPIKPMSTWVADTAPDLRSRAGIARADAGDPWGGMQWAGFTKEEMKGQEGKLDPDTLMLVNAAATSGDPDFDWAKRQPYEAWGDYLARIQGEAVGKVTGNEKLGAAVTTYINGVADTAAFFRAAKYTLSGPWKIYKHFKGKPINAPGTLMARLLTNPRAASVTGRIPAPFVKFMAGSDEMARLSNGRFFAGSSKWAQFFNPRAGAPRVYHGYQANLAKVGWKAGTRSMAANPSKFAALRTGLSAAGKTAGFWRFAGIGGSIAATGLGVADLWAQGNPVEAFKRDKAGYVKDVSGVAFNASLTAAMIAPNPITIGATIITGAVYGGAIIVDNWPKIKEGAKKAKDWVGDKAKKLGSALNPFD